MNHRASAWALAITLATAGTALAQTTTAYRVEPSQVAVDNERALQSVKRVAITQLVVQFIDRQDGSAVSGGFAGGASAKLSLRLAGPGPAEFQRITDALYEEVVQAARSAGLEVVPHEQLVALPDYQKLVAAGKPSPVEDEKFTGYGGWTYSPRGLPVAFDTDDEESFMQSSKNPDPRGEQYRSAGSLFAGNTTAGRWAEWGIAKALDAHLLKVRVTVPLAIIEASGGLLSGGASVKVKPMPRLARDVTRFAFRREREASRVRLYQHLLLAPDLASLETLSEKKDNTGGLNRAFGLLSSNSAAAEYRMNAAPERYEAEVLAAARASFSGFAQVLKARRNPS